MADDTPDTDQIEQDLAQTRARMDRRLDELGNKLAPDQLVNDALAHVSGGTGADFTQTLIAKAKANPIPAALTGIGVVWLLASSQSKKPRDLPDLQTRLRSAETGVVRLEDEHPEVHARRVDDARGQVLGIARGATDTAAFYSQRIKDAIASANQNVRHTSHDLGASASNAVSHLGDYARGSAGQSLASSPIVLGAVAALAGMVIAAFVPVSRQEEHALGSLAGQLRGRSRALVQDVVDRGAEVAGDALAAVKDSAQAHGLTAEKPVGELLGDLKSGELIGHIKQAAREVADAGRESVRSRLTPEADVKHQG